MFSKTIPAMLLAALIAMPVNAQKKDGNTAASRELMQRDLRIMEGVLDQLLNSDASLIVRAGRQTQGNYIPGFGVLFQTSAEGDLIRFLTVRNKKRLHDTLKKNVEVHVITEVPDEDISSDQPVPEEAVIEFLRDYVGNIRTLRDEDIALVVYYDLITKGDSAKKSGVFTELLRNKDENRVAMYVPVSVIRKYRRGDISEKKFREALVRIELADSRRKRRDLRVFTGILNSALRGNAMHTFSLDNDMDYIYVPKYGALFFGQAKYVGGDNFGVFFESNFGEIFDHNGIKLSMGKDKETRTDKERKIWAVSSIADSSSARKKREAFETFEKDIIETLVDYGRTLRELKPDEHIIVALKIRQPEKGVPERAVYRLKAKDLQRYDRGDIKRQELIRRIKTDHY